MSKLLNERNSENKSKKNQWFKDTSARTQEGDGSKRDGREIAQGGRGMDHVFNRNRAQEKFRQKFGKYKFVPRKMTSEENDMSKKDEGSVAINEMKYGATHEFRGTTEFMSKCADKVLKKHGIQVHSIETLPDEKETIYHVSGSVDAISKASSALWDEVSGSSKPIAYKPTKFQGSHKKYVVEETELNEEEMETEQDMTTEEILEVGPAAIMSAISTDSEDADEIFQSVMGAKIDYMLDGLKNELAAGMFETPEEVTTENLIAVLGDIGVELTEEQLEEAKLSGEGRKISTSDANAHKAQEAEHRGDFAGAKVFWKRSGLNRIGTKNGSAANLKLQIRGKSVRKEDVADILSSFGVNLTEEQLEIAEASLWKPQAAGFTKKGVPPKKGMKKSGEYDKAAHEKSSSASMVDQMTAKNR